MIPTFDDWRATPAPWKGGAVALGNFDGVHRGHQALLAHTGDRAKALGAPLVALTFEPHPRRFFVPDTGPFRLTLPPAKVRLLADYGVQAVLAQRFDEAFAALSADAFIDDVLLKGLGARHVVCGYDFTFGTRRSGNVEMLREHGRSKGFGVTVLDPVMHEGEIYSSTRIRETLRHGWISEAAEFAAAKDQIGREIDRAQRVGVAVPKTVQLGAMIEVPSLLFELSQIMSLADFVSVGSNDLLQFVFAADRTNPVVAKRYDTLSPAVLNLVRRIAQARSKAFPDISFCGEIAGRPLEAMVLVGLGITTLSMQASNIGPVKMMIRNLDTRPLKPVIEKLCAITAPSARTQLADFAARHGVPIGGRTG